MSDLLLEPVPNTEAAAFLKKKPALAGAVFGQLVPEVKARAFAISGIECAKTLQRLRDRIADLPLGGDWDAIKKDIVNEISPFIAKGEDAAADAAAAERRAELILRTHGYQAYAATQYRTMDAQRDVAPWWRYQTAQDDRVREAHRALDGVVVPANDDFWKTHFPPWDYNCRCTIVALSRADMAEIAAEDAGKPAPERSILTDDQLRGMNRGGFLIRGPATNVDVRSPRDRGRPNGYAWQPGDLRLSAGEIQQRYEAPVWQAFEEMARRTELDGRQGIRVEDAQGRPLTLWDWLNEDGYADAQLARERAAKPAPEPPPPAKPRQSPVSAALEIKPRGDLGKSVKRAVDLIDKAHDDGTLPTIPIQRMEAGRDVEAYYANRGPAAVRIAISPQTTMPLISTVHEVGHFIDQQALDVAGQWASQDSPLLEAWRTVVMQTPAIQALLKAQAAAKTPELITALEYVLRGREIWARAYAQWIATRTGDAAMLAELAALQADTLLGPLFSWSNAEFAPVAEAMENLFRSKGWL